MKLFWLVFYLFFQFPFLVPGQDRLPPFISEESAQWADSVILRLNPEQRIAQLFMVSAWSNKDSVHVNEISHLITEYGIGGLIFFQGGPVRQALLTNLYQSLSRVPLLIGIDGEWGLGMRLDSTIRFPRQMTLAAMHDDSLIYSMGTEIARECRRIGIHTNFSPVADINNNPLNPIIGSRSFGDEKFGVARDALIYMNALQDHHILATAKHFPGHGDTDMDSHLTLPTIRNSKNQMDTLELFPFRQLMKHGLGGVMVAHLSVPALDTIPDHPSTLSKSIVTGVLKEQMGFKGVAFTDALNMKAVNTCYKPGVLDKLALLAGNDVLLCSEDVHKAIDEIHLAVENCEISQEEIDRRVKKILMLKYWSGLNHYQPVDTKHLYEDLNPPSALLLQQELYGKSLTLLRNKDFLVPLQHLDSLRIASVVIGDIRNNPFQQQLQRYAPVDCYSIENDAPSSVFESMEKFLSNYDLVILSLHNTTMNSQKDFGITEISLKFISEVIRNYKTIFVDFGNAYTLSKLETLPEAPVLLLAYEDMPVSQNLAGQVLFGGRGVQGKIPVASTTSFSKNSGITLSTQSRFGFSFPEEVGIESEDLAKIDSIAWNAIRTGATPGCQVLVAKDQKIIYCKSFGTHTYDDTSRVLNSDLYDVASVTKIAATCLATMKLVDEKKIDLNLPLSHYLPELQGTNKKNLMIRDVLAHQAGLQSWIPFWKKTMTESGALSDNIYIRNKRDDFTIRVADGIYMRSNYRDSVMQWIYDSPVAEKGKYVYSDLGPILMKSAIEKITSRSLNQYLDDEFYRPLGLTNLSFLPFSKFNLNQLIPTEYDRSFRHELIHGDVHDPAAAMMGGVSGNAGLFSDAFDLAVIMQLYLNGGNYGGKQYIRESTVREFTMQQFPQNNNRRGLFFDKPEPDSIKPSPVSKSASMKTFGHQGFTGTCAWADPEYNLIYIFLSNRVNPDASNEKLVKMNVRTEIQQVIYDSILK